MKALLLIIILVVSSVSASDTDDDADEASSNSIETSSVESVQVQGVVAASKIHHELRSKLAKKDRVADCIITMADDTAPVLQNIDDQDFPEPNMKTKTLVDGLKDHSTGSQEKVVNMLVSSGFTEHIDYTKIWITNQVIIRGVNMAVLNKLDKIKEGNIEKIEEVRSFELIDEVEQVFDGDDEMPEVDPTLAQWGVEKMRCPKIWEKGITGEGIVVGTIDTGVRGTHEALKDSFVGGDYGWFDPSGGTPEPNDNNGHGTHTMGTLVGHARKIGVAPGAKWMSCRGCASDSCSVADLLICGQWMLCPTKADGTDADCTYAPHLVSNSWGGGTNDTYFNKVLAAWKSAGIMAVAAIGNSGPDCETAEYPGNSPDVIGVGSTEMNDEISDFSSAGPTPDGRMKPDISGPGSSILSAYYTSDTAYATFSGTSMACPHAAGLVALLLSKYEVDREDVITCLRDGAVPITSTGATCGNVSDTTCPNNNGGAGRIDCVNAFEVLYDLYY